MSAPARTGPRRPSGRAVALLLIVSAVMLLGIAPLRGYIDARGQLTGLRRQASQLEQQNAKLERRIEQLGDPTYLERLARACLGLVKPGETAFVIVQTNGRPTPPDC